MSPVREKPRVAVKLNEAVQTISGWPTDTISIDHVLDGTIIFPGTVLLFVPGNPGLCGWYTKMISAIVESLGVGYAARGVSYAGHGIGEMIIGDGKENQEGNRERVSWTVDGQVEHKIAWIEVVNNEFRDIVSKGPSSRIQGTPGNLAYCSSEPLLPNFVFVTHSIGAHLVQRVCVLRSDILKQTDLLVHLMPFIRFDPPQPQKTLLSTVARSPTAAIMYLQSACRLAASLPKEWVKVYLNKIARVDDDDGRELAANLVTQPAFARNFLELGLEEIRDVPERHDDAALRIIGKHCPTFMLFCGGPDQWAPHFHIEDLDSLRRQGNIPSNIYTEYCEDLVHDFVVRPTMIQPVIDFCIRSILSARKETISSRL